MSAPVRVANWSDILTRPAIDLVSGPTNPVLITLTGSHGGRAMDLADVGS